MTTSNLSAFGHLLEQTVRPTAAQAHKADTPVGDTITVPHIGNSLLTAYEQLRNASENIEEHLLVQSAIYRFFRRSLQFEEDRAPTHLGKELVIELTQAGYLQNNSVSRQTVNAIDTLVAHAHTLHTQVHARERAISAETTKRWILGILSVKSDQLLRNSLYVTTFAHVAHRYFDEHISYEKIIRDKAAQKEDYPTMLYIAVHRALLRSSDAQIRSALFDVYRLDLRHITADQFCEFNRGYDTLAERDGTTQLSRFVTRNGAPLRMLRAAFFQEGASSEPEDVRNKTRFLTLLDHAIDDEYSRVQKNITRGIIKSILFLLITKALVGVLIEIPYDLAVEGAIVWLPLAINLAFPPLFLALMAITFRLPGPANKQALLDSLERSVYQSSEAPSFRYTQPAGRNYAFNVAFLLIFIGVFFVVGDQLAHIGFNIVQGIIFVLFLSTASFLGYRLTVQIKELELISTRQDIITLLRDFFLLPFIVVGKHISYRFGQLNIVAQLLDAAIDLPLKTLVRLIRQWMVFLSNKRDELL